ncbi:methionyl-tRNA formyltransferase [Candidatus Woesearchaeota archaeon]|jgi:methionyl-tRNA formyltransferase|nr:methionyl-tRNA formyltransferase [Candidatus Woesearchaeota archaeon]MBT4763409.1 methionyl-tRNA formyltransferase [bacterium]
MSKKLNLGYFADGPWSHEAFKMLISDNKISIRFVCVRFDTQDITLKQYCKKYNIDYIKNANVNSAEFIEELSKYKCDLFVSMSFNQIFKKEIINLTKYNIINCHAGKLPFYRGRNILNWALINDESEFGITVHYVDEGIDTGDIILQDVYLIDDTDDYSTLLARSYNACASILYRAVCLFKDGSVVGKKQGDIHPTGFYCSQRKIGDEIINWKDSSRNIFNFIRSICSPGPMARTFINGVEIKINKAEMVTGALTYKCIEGAILNIDATGFIVKTKDSFIKITEYTSDIYIKVGNRLESK